jgi:hypothetical protein
MSWEPLIRPQVVKRRCIGCNAMVDILTDGKTYRFKPHSIGNHRHVPMCSASFEPTELYDLDVTVAEGREADEALEAELADDAQR